jgi:hypothetical protein
MSDNLIDIIETFFFTLILNIAIICSYFAINLIFLKIFLCYFAIIVLILLPEAGFCLHGSYVWWWALYSSWSEVDHDEPAGACTPPTPPFEDSLPSFPRPHRKRSVARLRPVSIPHMVRDIAGKDVIRTMGDFDNHYMPDGMPPGDSSTRGNADSQRADLKRKSDGISISLNEVFAYLTHGTPSP